MDNLNTYIIDTLANTLGHEPTLDDVVALNVPPNDLTNTLDLALTLAQREAARRYRAAQA